MGVEGGEVILSNIAGLGKIKSKMSSELGNEKGTADAVSVQVQDRTDAFTYSHSEQEQHD